MGVCERVSPLPASTTHTSTHMLRKKKLHVFMIVLNGDSVRIGMLIQHERQCVGG